MKDNNCTRFLYEPMRRPCELVGQATRMGIMLSLFIVHVPFRECVEVTSFTVTRRRRTMKLNTQSG